MGDPRRSGAPVAPLLVACALGIEQVALRSGRGVPGPVRVLRTGMGPRAAEAAVARLLGPGGIPDAAVIASGFCAGLAPGMHPGDLVVAEETRDADGTTPCTGTGVLVAALARAVPGRTVHTGPLTGSDHVVRGSNGPLCGRRGHRGGHGVRRDAAYRPVSRAAPGCGRPGGRGRSRA